MRTYSILAGVVAVVSVISVLCIWFYPSEQDFMASNPMWQGIKDFSREFGAGTAYSLDDLPESPEGTILVAIPYLPYTEGELAAIERFVKAGGALLLLDDFGYGNRLLAQLGVSARFSNTPLLDPVFCYRNQYMPRITEFIPAIKDTGVRVLMLNHATALTGVTEAEAIAWSSGASFLDLDGDGQWSREEPAGPFAVAARLRLGRGTLALVSDPSIIINAMLGQDDNYDFLRYLTRRESEQQGILVDVSHLGGAPLDASKVRLAGIRRALSNPYGLLGITAAIFLVVSRYTLKNKKETGDG